MDAGHGCTSISLSYAGVSGFSPNEGPVTVKVFQDDLLKATSSSTVDRSKRMAPVALDGSVAGGPIVVQLFGQ